MFKIPNQFKKVAPYLLTGILSLVAGVLIEKGIQVEEDKKSDSELDIAEKKMEFLSEELLKAVNPMEIRKAFPSSHSIYGRFLSMEIDAKNKKVVASYYNAMFKTYNLMTKYFHTETIVNEDETVVSRTISDKELIEIVDSLKRLIDSGKAKDVYGLGGME